MALLFYKIVGSTLRRQGSLNEIIYVASWRDRVGLLCLLHFYFLESIEKLLDIDSKWKMNWQTKLSDFLWIYESRSKVSVDQGAR